MGRNGKQAWVSPAEFHDLASKHPTATRGAVLLKQYLTDSKALDEAQHTVSFTITTGAVDRDKDSIKPSGWKFENYLRNPVVLFAHDYSALPVAKALELTQTEAGVRSVAQFAPADLNPFAAMVYGMVKAGYLNAASVGFRPLEWAINEERRGIDFFATELLEWSVVPVPAHPEALVEARSAGIDLAPLKAWAERVLDEWGKDDALYVPRDQAEAAYRIASNRSVWDKNLIIIPAGLPNTGVIVDGIKGDRPAIVETKPKPQAGESEDHFVSRCIPIVLDDGTAESPAQAAAICHSLYDQHHGRGEDPANGAQKQAPEDGEPIGKRGWVLSAANEARLREAMRILQDVCAQVENEPAAEDAALEIADKAPEEVIEVEDGTEHIEIAVPEEADTFPVDPDELKRALAAVLEDSIARAVSAKTTEAVNRLRGRVD